MASFKKYTTEQVSSMFLLLKVSLMLCHDLQIMKIIPTIIFLSQQMLRGMVLQR